MIVIYVGDGEPGCQEGVLYLQLEGQTDVEAFFLNDISIRQVLFAHWSFSSSPIEILAEKIWVSW